jgi:membrane fusion protein, multidrug efflux system
MNFSAFSALNSSFLPMAVEARCAYPIRRARVAPWLFAAALGLAACGDKGAAPAARPAGMPLAEVGVVTVQPADVAWVSELPGRTEASRVAQVRARAAGILLERQFEEGRDVKAGQPLFRIDAAPYEAALASAQAQLAKAEANQVQASALVDRYRPLVAERAVSPQDFLNAETAQKQAAADVALARAAVQTASLNRSYAHVTAPISGRIGRALVTEGALVGQGEATPLAVVQQIDPLYVNFTQPAADALRLARSIESGRFRRSGGAAAVRVVLEDGSVHPVAGRLLFTDLTVDSTSGQVTLRAEVPNPGGRLLPGLYVRVKLEQATVGNAITLPQQAVTRSARGDSVMVVGGDGKVSPRPVKVGGQQEGRWLVLEGLQPGEQVMVDGFQKLRGDAPVKPVPWQPSGQAPAKPDAKVPAKAS